MLILVLSLTTTTNSISQLSTYSIILLECYTDYVELYSIIYCIFMIVHGAEEKDWIKKKLLRKRRGWSWYVILLEGCGGGPVGVADKYNGGK